MKYYLDKLYKLQKRFCGMIFCLTLAALLERSTHRRNVANLTLFIRITLLDVMFMFVDSAFRYGL